MSFNRNEFILRVCIHRYNEVANALKIEVGSYRCWLAASGALPALREIFATKFESVANLQHV